MGEARAVLNRDARPASKVRLFSRANSGRSGIAGSTDNAAPTCRFAKRNTLALAISSIAGCDPEGSGGMVRKKALVARNAGRLSNTRGTAGAGMTESAHKMFGQASSQPAPGSTAADVRAVAAHIAVRIADAAVDDLRALRPRAARPLPSLRPLPATSTGCTRAIVGHASKRAA